MTATAPAPSPADNFGAVATGIKSTNPASGIAYTLGFGPPGVDGNPIGEWVVASTWAVAKSRLGPTWAQAKQNLATWGAAKAVVAV